MERPRPDYVSHENRKDMPGRRHAQQPRSGPSTFSLSETRRSGHVAGDNGVARRLSHPEGSVSIWRMFG